MTTTTTTWSTLTTRTKSRYQCCNKPNTSAALESYRPTTEHRLINASNARTALSTITMPRNVIWNRSATYPRRATLPRRAPSPRRNLRWSSRGYQKTGWNESIATTTTQPSLNCAHPESPTLTKKKPKTTNNNYNQQPEQLYTPAQAPTVNVWNADRQTPITRANHQETTSQRNWINYKCQLITGGWPKWRHRPTINNKRNDNRTTTIDNHWRGEQYKLPSHSKQLIPYNLFITKLSTRIILTYLIQIIPLKSIKFSHHRSWWRFSMRCWGQSAHAQQSKIN